MSKWQSGLSERSAFIDEGLDSIGRRFADEGLVVSVLEGASCCQFTLEPADALALADAIKREYGGRDE